MAKDIIFSIPDPFLLVYSLPFTRCCGPGSAFLPVVHKYLPLPYWNVSLDGRLFTTLILFSESFSSQFNLKMEDRMADVVEEMVPADMVAVSGSC